MNLETDLIKSKIAISLIKEKEFSMSSWESVLKDIKTLKLATLLFAVRNALNYATETKTLKGMVKTGFIYAIATWDEQDKTITEDLKIAGDKIIKTANDYLKKNKIKVEK
ncbi:hypothetical protein GQ473_03680 [archaeon]|nr:hypothetical protein [archaeon]